jgi:hypothetical protein
MRLLGTASSVLVLITFFIGEATAAPFQNLSFENYPGGPTLPNWQLVMWQGNGTLLYKGDGPGSIGLGYPFVGFHIGDGPIIGVGPAMGATPAALEGNNSLTLGTYGSGAFNSEAAARAYIDTLWFGGIAQAATVPANAKSFWIATPVNSGPPSVSFSGHNLQMRQATHEETYGLFQSLGVVTPDALGGPNPFPGPATWQLWGGNVETIAGIDRELVLRGGVGFTSFGPNPNMQMYEVYSIARAADMLMFSSFPWDGPAVNVPEPAATLLLLPAIAALRRRRHHA